MTVLILDLDWIFDKSDLPNPGCMHLSSFHKQRKDRVYFVGDMSELTMAYDKLYVFSESDSTPTLGSKILNDERTTLFGKRFELCGAKKLGPAIMGCRPDYLLYNSINEKSSSYLKAHFITFFTDAGERIITRQDWKNTNKGFKRTIVADRSLWRQKPSEIEECFEMLKDEKNIVFLEPISIRLLIGNKSIRNKFFALHFAKGTKFKWRNDFGSDVESAHKIVDFLQEFRSHTKTKVGSIPIQPYAEGTLEENLMRLLQIFAIFKRAKLNCFLPLMDKSEPTCYTWLRRWYENAFENSFIEEMVFFVAAKEGQRWYQIVNNPQHWGNAKIKFLIQLLSQKQFQSILPEMSVQWGNNSIDYAVIDLKLIEQHATALI